MAEHTIDRVIKDKGLRPAGPCVTKEVPLIGSESFESNLPIKLVQKYGLNDDVAQHLVSAYGMRAVDVCERTAPTGRRWPRYGNVLVEGYPFVEAEVEYACAEYCRSVKDLLSLRMRLAFLNSEAAKEIVPRVAALMAKTLHWSSREQARQEKEALAYLSEFGGPVPDKTGAKLRASTFADLRALFRELDTDGSGFLDMHEIEHAAQRLGFPFESKAELHATFERLDKDGNGRVEEEELSRWNGPENDKDGLWKKLHHEINVTPAWEG